MNRLNKQLSVTSPLLPAIDELLPYLREIWDSGTITNGGIVSKKFENELCQFLGVKHISLFSSGTLALVLALKSLDLKGEIITTPFTHISTVQAIYWNNLKPVFVDINKSNLNIDVNKIERAIGPNTTAILPVHVFGNPCDVEAINKLALKYNLKIIYDAAHSFGVKIGEKSICNYGDLSILSFHATKVFNSIEGGAVICHTESMKKYLDALKNSGVDENYHVIGYGLNAKMNEIQAAYGSVLLKHVDIAINKRKMAVELYHKLFKKLDGITLFKKQELVRSNYSFLPIILDSNSFGASLEEVITFLESNNIFPKRYFYPLVTNNIKFQKYKAADLPKAESICNNVICLPLSHEIASDEIEYVVSLFGQLYHKNRNNRIETYG